MKNQQTRLLVYELIDHFHIHFETEALSLTERRATILQFFCKQTLHDFSASTKLTALFAIKR